MTDTHQKRWAGVAILVMLAAGFIYSGVATFWHLSRVFQQPAATGISATINSYLGPANLLSSEEVRRAASSLVPANEQIFLLADGSGLSRDEIQHIYYATSYLLYPRRIVLVQHVGSDRTATSVVGSGAAIVVGSSDPFPADRIRRLSNMLSLVRQR